MLKKNAGFLVSLGLIFIVRGTFADQNVVPSGSMEPTIHVGDHIFVNKLAYDLHLPYSKVILARLGEPHRGDIIVFHNPRSGIRMVKRLIGLPGDHVEIRDGFVWINGAAMEDAEANARKFGKFEEFEYKTRIGDHVARIKRTPDLFHPDFYDFVVPAGQYFAMGDNRDNSYDSRGWGFIPRADLEGRAVGVIYNMNWAPFPHGEWECTAMGFQ